MRKLLLEQLEDRTCPALAVAYVNDTWAGLSSGTVIADADPAPGNQPATIGTDAFAALAGVSADSIHINHGAFAVNADIPASIVVVNTPASLEIAADVTSVKTFVLNSSALQLDTGSTLYFSGEIDGGTLTGGGTLAIIGNSSLNGVTTGSAVTVTADVGTAPSGTRFNSCTIGGTVVLAAGQTFTFAQTTVAATGRLLIYGTANVTDFVSNGVTIVGSSGKLANVGASGLVFGGGSMTTVNRVGSLDMVDDGVIDIGGADAIVRSGIMVNNGIVGSSTSNTSLIAEVNALAVGTGLYVSLFTRNGGRYSPGGMLNQPANIVAPAGSMLSTANQTAGQLTITDVDAGQAAAKPATGTTHFGSFTLNAAGAWTYFLDHNDADLIAALAQSAVVNDFFAVFSADGTEQIVKVTITK